MLSFTGCIFLVITYSSPYWLASWEDTRFRNPRSPHYFITINLFFRSPFLNLGLWTVCFHLFRHPKVQFDHLYSGCYSVWGDSLKMIAYWVVPGWMILIQVLATCSLITALTAQLLSISILLRLPLQIVLRLISTNVGFQ